MRRLFVLLLVLIVSPAAATIREKPYHRDGRIFTIRYEVDFEGWYIEPSTDPPGEPHWPAEVLVYEWIDGDMIYLGEGYGSTFVEDGCFEDVPDEHVSRAAGWLPLRCHPIHLWNLPDGSRWECVTTDTWQPLEDD